MGNPDVDGVDRSTSRKRRDCVLGVCVSVLTWCERDVDNIAVAVTTRASAPSEGGDVKICLVQGVWSGHRVEVWDRSKKGERERVFSSPWNVTYPYEGAHLLGLLLEEWDSLKNLTKHEWDLLTQAFTETKAAISHPRDTYAHLKEYLQPADSQTHSWSLNSALTADDSKHTSTSPQIYF